MIMQTTLTGALTFKVANAGRGRDLTLQAGYATVLEINSEERLNCRTFLSTSWAVATVYLHTVAFLRILYLGARTE